MFRQPGANGAGAMANDNTDGTIKGLAVDADGYPTVTINGVIAGDMEVLRFQQNDVGGGGEDLIAMFGSNEISIKRRLILLMRAMVMMLTLNISLIS